MFGGFSEQGKVSGNHLLEQDSDLTSVFLRTSLNKKKSVLFFVMMLAVGSSNEKYIF